MKPVMFNVPETKKVRVILDTDCACEADDQFAIVHALMSPKLDVVGICAEHFADRFGPDSQKESFDEINKILDLAKSNIPVYKGSSHAIEDISRPEITEASSFIIKEALKDDDRPLFIAGMAALSNVANAILKEPKIASRITLVWIGGGSYPDGESEFNLENDVKAANVVLNSAVEFWQVPKNVYSSVYIPLSLLYQRIYNKGPLGKYLVDRIVKTNDKFVEWIKRPTYTKGALSASYPGGEMWILGDSPAISLILFDEKYSFSYEDARTFNEDCTYGAVLQHKKIRVYKSVDSQFIFTDFLSKFDYHFS